MKNLFYSIGIASFLVCMIFTVATSVTNPFYGMSDAAVAQATTQTTTTGSNGSTITYEFNGNLYDIRHPDQVTLTRVKRKPSNSYKGTLGGLYNGVGAEGTITHNKGYEENTVSATYVKPTVCNPGGDFSCSKSSEGETLFNVYY